MSEAAETKTEETVEQMKTRHAQKLQALRNKPLQGKKKVARKRRNREIEDLIFYQEKELADLEGPEDGEEDPLYALAQAAIEREEQEREAAKLQAAKEQKAQQLAQENRIKSKKAAAARAKANKAAREATRDAEIAEEVKGLSDYKQVELNALQAVLGPKKLKIVEVQADGHCMFRAIGAQLRAKAGKNSTVEGLRNQVADYMRTHETDFRPFVTTAEGDLVSAQGFQDYCSAMCSSTEVVWGGNAELVALNKVLEQRITVYHAKGQPHEFGDDRADQQALTISYHEHYYGLGQHYNSVMPTQ
jgi:OTU domain-containing protein 6